MFSNLMVGAVFGLGFGGWVYNKLIRSTGGNTANALLAAVLSGLFVMVVITTLLSLIFN